MAKRVLEARVKQKKDTLANWMANPLVLLDGEQAFVTNANGREVNYKIGDGTKTFAELEYMIQYDQAAFVSVAGNVLPPNDGSIHYTLVGAGTYTQSGGSPITVADGTMAVLADDGAGWYVNAVTPVVKGDKGDPGEQGEQGIPGATGNSLEAKGSVQSYSDLANISPSPQMGDAWVVNDDGLIYIYGENGFPPQGEGIALLAKKAYTLTEW